jgi:hypothetical protein
VAQVVLAAQVEVAAQVRLPVVTAAQVAMGLSISWSTSDESLGNHYG